MFQPELKTQKVRVKEDERGLVISPRGGRLLRPGQRAGAHRGGADAAAEASSLLSSPEFSGRKFRIEGHTDSLATDPAGPYPTNWELSTARATNVLHYLVDFGVNERQFQVAGFADTVPLAANDTPEGRAYNRRVDIVLLTPRASVKAALRV